MGLRVGLTGGLGSGKSTVAAMLREHGAYVLSADEIARGLMAPGQPVFSRIAEYFSPEVVSRDGSLNRTALARIAFTDGRVEELNAIIHPATIVEQASRMKTIFVREPDAIVVVESALLFETQHGDNWRKRFDRIVLVTASEHLKIERFVTRSAESATSREALEAEARRRLARILPDEEKAPQCDFVLRNDGSLAALQLATDALWVELKDLTPIHTD